VDAAGRQTVIHSLLAGEFNNPVRIVAFNAAEGWLRDVPGDIADEARQRPADRDEISEPVIAFLIATNRH